MVRAIRKIPMPQMRQPFGRLADAGQDVLKHGQLRGKGGKHHEQEEQRTPDSAADHVVEDGGHGVEEKSGTGADRCVIGEAGGEDDKAGHNGDKGIQKDYIVVDGNGLVGRVMEVGSDWSKVVSILSQNNNISFRVTRKQSISGVVQANNKGELEGFVMNEKAKIVKGDTLVTSGVGIYPEGIKIGKVKEVDYDENKQLKVITISPTVTFDSLQKVAIFK